MKKRISSVTKKGQVTIPQVVREKLEINYGDKIEFVIDNDNQVRIKPIKVNLENIYGVLKDENTIKNKKKDPELDRKQTREWIAGKKGRL
ncbi:MAG: type II toxin-antitoxin system PrlF family antitoxin [Bacillota bacterium]